MKRPFDEFIIKVATRCNLNCDYCYEYNSGDDSWKHQPKFMSVDVARQAARRIREHALAHDVRRVQLLFHGGEPLLAGLERLRDLTATFRRELGPGIVPLFGTQTNGTLLSGELVRFFEHEGFGVGVSVDGPPEVNDRHRLTVLGGGSGAAVQRGLDLVQHSRCFSGILCVVSVRSDPLAVWDFIAGYDPPMVDLLLPHGTWDRRPDMKDNADATPYADWMIRIFDQWFDGDHRHVPIRYFEEIIRHSLGGRGYLETLGLEPMTLLVIAANGDYEGVDTLKAVTPGAHVLGMNVADNRLDDLLDHPKVVLRQGGVSVRADQCKACRYVDTCGGGYVTHRYSAVNGFRNPSVYCSDLYKLIGHIRGRIREVVKSGRNEAPAADTGQP